IALPDPIGSETTFSREQFARDEKQRIAEALSQQKWNVASVARQLGIPRPSLYRKLKRYGLLRGSE
ncbi:MAG TPA: helix-turn-helix domain-containing protein, partial [Polyangiaceae bacterium]|nr:helix-turn-helix domain-containing protein [Polyangiaceae bacterium]